MKLFAGLIAAGAALALAAGQTRAQATQPGVGERMLDQYFRAETEALAARSLADVKTLADWNAKKEGFRHELADMLGLAPMPAKSDLQPVVVGRIEHDGYAVERLFFQSRPGLYVTANLYIPNDLRAPAPGILYVCGHALVKKNGVSFGNKAGYQHHGAWFARNGYVCLIPDTLQLGEIEGIHHGLHRERMWWWLSRGYTPAGVEAWNGIRCLDYLQSRPEVDPERLGMTGRSGGGAYTWWVAALDERVKAAVPVAGITDLHNHVVDGVIEGHCDCMFMVNTYRWDFAQVAALLAPRPLLIANSDKDTIFPLDGVVRLHEKVRRIYKLHGAEKNLGLLITEGPHKDTQDLQVPAFRWFNRFLKKDEGALSDASAEKPFAVERLRVFPEHSQPGDQINTLIQETFVPAAPAAAVPESAEAWGKQRDAWLGALKSQSFAAWPATDAASNEWQVFSATQEGVYFRAYEFTSQENVKLRVYVASPADFNGPERVVLNVLDEPTARKLFAQMGGPFAADLKEELAARGVTADGTTRPSGTGTTRPATGPATTRASTRPATAGPIPTLQAIRSGKVSYAWLAPRGVGVTAWGGTEKADTHIRRRFALLGQTLEGQRVYDVRRAIQTLRSMDEFDDLPLHLESQNTMGAVALYASLFEPDVKSLDLYHLPASHREGPQFLNVMKILDVPAAVAMAAERSEIRLHQPEAAGWEYPAAVVQRMKWTGPRLLVKTPGR